MKKLICTFFVLVSLSAFAQVQKHWIASFYYSPSSAAFINTDLAGNSYVVGFMTGMDSPIITYLQAYAPAGQLLWDTVIMGTPCSPVGVSMDSLFNQYIAGYYPGGWGPANSTVMKYSPGGTRLWSVIEPINYNDRMYAMAGDKAGNVFVAEYKNGQDLLRKYNSAGVLLFSKIITDTITPASMASDNWGSTIAAGTASINSAICGITIKYSQTGSKMWRSVYIPEGGNVVNYPSSKVFIVPDGSIYVLCTTFRHPYSNDYTLIKYNSSGVQQWVNYFDRNHGSDEARFIAADNTGNIIVTGSSGSVKYNPLGVLLWADTTSWMNSVTIDRSGNIYAAGSTLPYYNSDIRTLKLSPSGTRLWSVTYNGSMNWSDAANAIALDSASNVFVAGYCNSGSIHNLSTGTTIKYVQTSMPDTESLNFLPLAIGNIWVYKHYTNTPPSSNFEYRGRIRFEIKKDTLMPNGKTYFDRTYLGYTRIDPQTLTVFQYIPPGELKRDSLRAKLFDTVITCYRVTDTSNISLFGQPRRNKFVSTYCIITNQQLMWNLTYGLGYFTYGNFTNGTTVGYLDSLAGAVINGIVYGDTSMTGVQKISSKVPDKFSLCQNYPNPFNPKSKIKFEIAKSSEAKIIVYDALGREVAVLVNEQLKPGTYEVEFDGTNFPSGVYFYKLIAGDHIEIRKMILVK